MIVVIRPCSKRDTLGDDELNEVSLFLHAFVCQYRGIVSAAVLAFAGTAASWNNRIGKEANGKRDSGETMDRN